MGLGISQFTSLEPARKFLGVLKFGNIPNSDITVYAFSLSKTSSDPIAVRRHAEVSYYPGQISPDEISVSVYLFQGQLEQLKKAFFGKTYDPKSGAIGASSIRTTATLELWGPDGSPTGKIVLLNAWITSIDIGNISWRENDIIDATLGLRFDKLQES
ncbi:MAG: hypothetical protein QW303_08640 [Nitrososphaerota archaeon]